MVRTEEMTMTAWCPCCGPEPHVDEDGCCTVCGATVGEVPDVSQAIVAARAEALREAIDACYAEGQPSDPMVQDACAERIRALPGFPKEGE